MSDLRPFYHRLAWAYEASAPGGSPIQVQVETELAPRLGDALFAGIINQSLTERELMELAELADAVDVRGGIQELTRAQFDRVKTLQDKEQGERAWSIAMTALPARHGHWTEAGHREILDQALMAEIEPSFETLAAELRKLTRRRRQTPAEDLLRQGRDER